MSTETVECRHCGREHEVSGQAVVFSEEHAGGKFSCSGCLGLEPLPADIRDELLECDSADCDDVAPFDITIQSGTVHRCRECLLKDLKMGMWDFYHPEDSPKRANSEANDG